MSAENDKENAAQQREASDHRCKVGGPQGGWKAEYRDVGAHYRDGANRRIDQDNRSASQPSALLDAIDGFENDSADLGHEKNHSKPGEANHERFQLAPNGHEMRDPASPDSLLPFCWDNSDN